MTTALLPEAERALSVGVEQARDLLLLGRSVDDAETVLHTALTYALLVEQGRETLSDV